MVMKYNDSSSLSMDDFKDLSDTILAIQPVTDKFTHIFQAVISL